MGDIIQEQRKLKQVDDLLRIIDLNFVNFKVIIYFDIGSIQLKKFVVSSVAKQLYKDNVSKEIGIWNFRIELNFMF